MSILGRERDEAYKNGYRAGFKCQSDTVELDGYYRGWNDAVDDSPKRRVWLTLGLALGTFVGWYFL